MMNGLKRRIRIAMLVGATAVTTVFQMTCSLADIYG